jgi:hypothetical protein
MSEMPGLVNTAWVVYNVATAIRNARIEDRARRDAAALHVIDECRELFADLADIRARIEDNEEAGDPVEDRRPLVLAAALGRLRRG